MEGKVLKGNESTQIIADENYDVFNSDSVQLRQILPEEVN